MKFKPIAVALLLLPHLGLAQTRLTETEAESRYPRPSPDGERILFESNRGGKWHVYLMNRDGSDVRRVTDRAAEERHPAWSPDGDRIVFNSEGDLYLFSVEDGRLEQLTDEEGDDLFPDWSPDGNWITYSRQRNGQIDLFKTHVSDGGTVRLTEGRFRDVWPRWSPDGHRILFFSRRDTEGEDDELYVMESDGSAVERVTWKSGHDFCPAWAPDGRRIAAGSVGEPFGRGIALLTLGGDIVEVLARGFHRATEVSWSPDGSYLLYAARENEQTPYGIFFEEIPP